MQYYTISKVVLANVDAKADTGGVTSLVLDKCWRWELRGGKHESQQGCCQLQTRNSKSFVSNTITPRFVVPWNQP